MTIRTGDDPRVRFRDRVDPRVVGMLKPLVRALGRVHPSRIEGLANLPAGPALLVGNHGVLGYETALFFDALLDATGRMPLGLADRWFFRIPGLRDVLVRCGGMYGSPENALSALARGALVVCYPGGAREVLKHHSDLRYRLLWGKAHGFVRVALRAGVPIVPFAAAGVDDTFDVIARLQGSGELLMGHAKYDLPLVWGRGPLPKPVPFWFRIGEPITMPDHADFEDESAIAEVHEAAWSRTQALLDGLMAEYRCAA